jgi:hypothetical protein
MVSRNIQQINFCSTNTFPFNFFLVKLSIISLAIINSSAFHRLVISPLTTRKQLSMAEKILSASTTLSSLKSSMSDFFEICKSLSCKNSVFILTSYLIFAKRYNLQNSYNYGYINSLIGAFRPYCIILCFKFP